MSMSPKCVFSLERLFVCRGRGAPCKAVGAITIVVGQNAAVVHNSRKSGRGERASPS
jgi:hypothetical protein